MFQLCEIFMKSRTAGVYKLCARYQNEIIAVVNELISTVEVIDEKGSDTLLNEVNELTTAIRKDKALDRDGTEAELWEALGSKYISPI